MAHPKSLETSFSLTSSEPTVHAFPHEVKRVVKSLNTDYDYADQGLSFYTELIEMDDGIRYIATTNTIEADNDKFAADMLSIEGTAWVTKDGGFYRKRHIAQALDFQRPSMIVGAQRNRDHYASLNRSTDDLLAIYAFQAARFGYDEHYASSMGTSRGGMMSINIQKRAPKYGVRIVDNYSMVPCIPFVTDTLKMMRPGNIIQMIKNEAAAIRELSLSPEDMSEMKDSIDLLSVDGAISQLKEGIALGTSNIGLVVRKSTYKGDVGDIKVQEGDRMSFAHKWNHIFRDHPNTYVEVIPGGGHSSSIGREGDKFYDDWYEHAGALATVLHVEASRRHMGDTALRQMLDAQMREPKIVES